MKFYQNSLLSTSGNYSITIQLGIFKSMPHLFAKNSIRFSTSNSIANTLRTIQDFQITTRFNQCLVQILFHSSKSLYMNGFLKRFRKRLQQTLVQKFSKISLRGSIKKIKYLSWNSTVDFSNNLIKFISSNFCHGLLIWIFYKLLLRYI